MSRLFVISPEKVFLLFAIIYGVVYLFAVPPLRSPDEYPHFLRVIELSKGGIVGNTFIDVDILKFNREYRDKNRSYRHESKELYDIAEMKRDATEVINKNDTAYLKGFRATVYTPLPYIVPTAIVASIYYLMDVSSLVLLYAARLGGLIVGIALFYKAIQIIPIGKWAMCLVGLLPVVVYTRSAVTADSFTLGVVVLYAAYIMHYYMRKNEVLSGKQVVWLAVLATVLALCKTAYAMIPFMVLILPSEKYGSLKQKIYNVATILAPGQIANICWTLYMKQRFYSGDAVGVENAETYMPRTNLINPDSSPDMQIEYILTQPFEYLRVLWNTFTEAYFYDIDTLRYLNIFHYSLEGIVSGLGSIGRDLGLSAVSYVYVVVFIAAILLANKKESVLNIKMLHRLLLLSIIAASVIVTLTLLYIQWSPYQHHVVGGFQGRYLLPLVPLLVISFIPKFVCNRYVWLVPCGVILVSLWSLTEGFLNILQYEYGYVG